MRESDFDPFCQLVDAAYDLIGTGANKVISAGAKTMFFAALDGYSLEVVRAALSAHCLDRARGRFTPKPADLIEQIEAAAAKDGRPGAEEAWAIALASRDEAETIVWTAETAEAFDICKPVLSIGDDVAARMTFKEAYTRIVARARAERVPAAWTSSIGWDVSKRDAVIERAIVAGHLPAPVLLTIADESEGLSECPEGLIKLKAFVAELAIKRIEKADDIEAEKVAARAATAARKAELAAQAGPGGAA